MPTIAVRPVGGAIRAVIEPMDPVMHLVQTVCPLFNDSGWAYYFTPETIGKGKELGLGGMVFYIAGRGGMLGDCEGEVVAAAFGYFNPAVIVSAWDQARATAPIREIGRAHFNCAADHGRAKLANIPNLKAFVAAAEAVNNAGDPDSMPLYASFKHAEYADDLPGRAMQLVATLREFRGSAHLLAIRAKGLNAKQAHFVKRPSDVKMFGWSEEEPPHIDDQVRATMLEIEALTDELVAPAYSVLDAAGQKALTEGAIAIHAALTAQ